ncbi:MAG: hypothetical protein JWQ67_1460 [Marmoricola sp.]|jgi:hypothetical protein|nr:hypothetical protein [Marmoricola sp.]
MVFVTVIGQSSVGVVMSLRQVSCPASSSMWDPRVTQGFPLRCSESLRRPLIGMTVARGAVGRS